jgi:hypothetical protein
MITATTIPSNPVVGLLVAVILFGFGRMIIHRVARAEDAPWLVRILTWSLVLHLLAAPAQIFVVEHVYHSVADWQRYTHQGSAMAGNLHHFDFTTAGTGIGKIVNDGSVSIATGIVMAIVGSDDLATFLVFAWLSFLGGILYYRAFTLTFGGAGLRRYAYFVFLLPSILFWTGDSSKEAIMFWCLGLIAYGAARILRSRRGGFLLMVPGVVIGVLIRPNEVVLLLGGFAVAMTIRVVSGRGAGPLRRILGFTFGGVLLVFSFFVTQHYLLHGGSSITGQLSATNASNSLNVGGVSSGGVPYSSNPLTFPRDIYEVLFNPLPINAHGSAQLIAAAENTVILVLILASLRQLRYTIRASFARPYVLLCFVYSMGFLYAFAALGNLGLIERERTLLLPFLLVLLCIPRGPKRAPPSYEWELKRKDRRRLQPLFERTDGRLPSALTPVNRAAMVAPIPGAPSRPRSP